MPEQSASSRSTAGIRPDAESRPVDWTSDDWSTPAWLIQQLEHEFGAFELDPCCRPETAKAPRYFTREQDGLLQPWAPARVFMNPPYSDPVPWLAKARREAELGALVVCLLQAATDTGWFHDVVKPYAEVRFIRGRVRFIGWAGTPIDSPKMGSLLAIYRPPAVRA